MPGGCLSRPSLFSNSGRRYVVGETMHRMKLDRYAEHLDELRAAGIRYVPFVMSSWGRLHPEAANTLERLAMQAARRQGVADHRPLRRRAAAALGVAVQTRAVAMTRACLPKLSEEALRLLFGEAALPEDYEADGAA